MINATFMSLSTKILYSTIILNKTAANLSRIMDTSGGGPLVYGGFHRIFGGHDFLRFQYLVESWT
jgi:hypothetical protein